jgi:hypothetical protein
VVTEDDVRRAALGLPETSERPSYGTPGFRVGDRLFARVRDDGDLLVWCAGEDEKAELLASDPRVFWTTPHYDGHASVLVRLAEVDPDELAELLADSWRLRAPRRLVQQWTGRM